jgi:hypothetical protein
VALETYRLNPPRILILEPERSVAVGIRDNSGGWPGSQSPAGVARHMSVAFGGQGGLSPQPHFSA